MTSFKSLQKLEDLANRIIRLEEKVNKLKKENELKKEKTSGIENILFAISKEARSNPYLAREIQKLLDL